MGLSLNPHTSDPKLNVLRMQECRDTVGNCRRCSLHKGRKRIVFGAGNPSAPILILNAKPSYHEDKSGIPLAGRGGKILKHALSAVGLRAKRDIFCTNLVKCRPPWDSSAEALCKVESSQIKSCAPFLDWQQDIISPAVIVLHGKFVNQTLLGDQRALGQYVGTFRRFGKKTLALSTHNPAGLFGEREELISEYLLHWRELALRLNTLGRLWRPDAACFKDNWNYTE